MFVDKLKSAPQLITFADVMLLPGKAETEPNQVSLHSHVTNSIKLAIPYVTSPMDTVTGADMAIAIARVGGVGVLHRNCSIEDEVKMARKVKRAESFIISDVHTISPEIYISKAKQLMKELKVSGLPVVDEEERVIGILTKRDVRFASDMSTVS